MCVIPQHGEGVWLAVGQARRLVSQWHAACWSYLLLYVFHQVPIRGNVYPGLTHHDAGVFVHL
jgi:hypothetical protein